MDDIAWLAVIVIAWVYFQIICSRNKKYFRDIQLYNKNIKAEQKRRFREEQLKMMRVKHPKVVYLSDRQKSKNIPNKIN